MSNQTPQQTYSQYKIRKITKNEFGNVYGITIPREIGEKFEGVKFTLEVQEQTIILKSGLDISKLKKEVEKYSFDDLE